jgi:hypothetical protein
MKRDLFSSSRIRAIAVAGVVAGVASLPLATASADTGSSTLLVTAQGTSLFGQEIPVLGTQDWYVAVPAGSDVLPGEAVVWDALDFTVTSSVTVGNQEILELDLDPRMAK